MNRRGILKGLLGGAVAAKAADVASAVPGEQGIGVWASRAASIDIVTEEYGGDDPPSLDEINAAQGKHCDFAPEWLTNMARQKAIEYRRVYY